MGLTYYGSWARRVWRNLEVLCLMRLHSWVQQNKTSDGRRLVRWICDIIDYTWHQRSFLLFELPVAGYAITLSFVLKSNSPNKRTYSCNPRFDACLAIALSISKTCKLGIPIYNQSPLSIQLLMRPAIVSLPPSSYSNLSCLTRRCIVKLVTKARSDWIDWYLTSSEIRANCSLKRLHCYVPITLCLIRTVYSTSISLCQYSSMWSSPHMGEYDVSNPWGLQGPTLIYSARFSHTSLRQKCLCCEVVTKASLTFSLTEIYCFLLSIAQHDVRSNHNYRFRWFKACLIVKRKLLRRAWFASQTQRTGLELSTSTKRSPTCLDSSQHMIGGNSGYWPLRILSIKSQYGAQQETNRLS